MRLQLAIPWLALVAVLTAAEPVNQLTPAEKQEGYVLLFKGKNLDGWEGNPALWSVENGTITGTTDSHPIQENTFLIYRDRFSDFILRFDIKLRNHNSGVQFRSTVLPNFVVTGYQADASEAGDHSAWGNFYEEKGRGRAVMKTEDEGWQKAKSLVRHGNWNSYEVFAQGSHMRLKFNGAETIDLTDDKARDGVIALQLHAGEPMRVEFRNLRLKVLR
ncbi:exported hypothetical protein [Candidatus Sulfopaludibacter sp. SbA6]|nr:exported hypothetical protein [Candidatus Sulfopaludibacter sp. SbA6]